MLSLPADWTYVELKKIVDPARKITYGIVKPGEFHATGRFLIRAKDYSNGWVDIEDFYRVSDEIERAYKRARVRTGDILVTIVGSVGNIAVVPQFLEGANITQQTARVAINSALADPRFCFYYFQSEAAQLEFYKYLKRGVQPALNLSDLEMFNIPLPPLPEQRAIAAILSTWDEAITLTEYLIAALQQRKQGLMQILLTGEVRFPAFEGSEWGKYNMGQIANYIKGYSYESSDYSEKQSPFNFITLKCIGKGGGFQVKGLKYLVQDVDDRFKVTEGDLVFANTDLTREAEVVGAPVLIPALDGFSTIISMDLTKLVPKSQVSKQFLYYLMQTQEIRNFFKAHASGSTVLHLDIAGTKKLRLLVPQNAEEQQIITNVLSTCDTEINAYHELRGVFEIQKKALMQQLLTGQIRVNID